MYIQRRSVQCLFRLPLASRTHSVLLISGVIIAIIMCQSRFWQRSTRSSAEWSPLIGGEDMTLKNRVAFGQRIY